MMNNTVLRVDNLSLGYTDGQGNKVAVLRDVSLDIQRGEVIGLVGESGCGKSTLALALLGFLRSGGEVLGGTISYEQQSLFALPASELVRLRGGQIALIPQNAGQSLTPTMTLQAQLYEALQLHSDLPASAWQARAIELLTLVRLPSPAELLSRYPHQLSGGQQQRVAIAMALAGEPEVLLLDEPTTGLDVTTQAHILELLRELRQRLGTTMVFVSHDLGVIARVSDRIAVMYAGEMVELGDCAEVLRQPAHPYTRGLLAAIPRLAADTLPAALPGYPPQVGSVKEGCVFAGRCGQVTPLCQQVSPDLATLGGRQVRCNLPAESLRAPLQLGGVPVPQVRRGEPLLALDQVAVSYGKPGLWQRLRGQPDNRVATVDGIELSLRRGETLALVGESGSGKSTIMRSICGLNPPRNGAITLQNSVGDKQHNLQLNQPVEQRDASLKRRVQMIFQNPDASLNPRHTIADILAQPLKLYFGLTGEASRTRAAELLAQVRLGEHYLDRLPAQLSGGEKQRVAIARTFAGEPDLILCDEVTSALDVSVQAAVLKLLKQLQAERGVAYLFIAHDLAVVQAIADKVAVLYQGRLCEEGQTAALFSAPWHPYTETLLDAVLQPDPDHAPRLHADDSAESQPPVQGCPFQNRCPRKLGTQCDTELPGWQQVNSKRLRCHIPAEQLLRLQKPDEIGAVQVA